MKYAARITDYSNTTTLRLQTAGKLPVATKTQLDEWIILIY